MPPVLLFPNELIVEILSWLPVKSLLRFRCVSKVWKSLISDPQFVKLHLGRSPRDSNLFVRVMVREVPHNGPSLMSCTVRSLLDNRSPNIDEDYVAYPFKDWNGRVVGSCNGLICLFVIGSEGWLGHCVQLWNPATRLRSQNSPTLFVNTTKFNLNFGFGYEHGSDNYKVVAVFFHQSAKEDAEKPEVKVYSMGDNCWRNIQRFPGFGALSQDDGVYLSGTLNWVVLHNISDYRRNKFTNDQLLIVSLNMSTETYNQAALPHFPEEIPHFKPTLGVLRDCLSLFYAYNEAHIDIWQMKEFGVQKSWTLLMNISFENLQIPFLHQHYSPLPLRIFENSDLLLLLAVGAHHDQAVLYNHRDNRVEYFAVPRFLLWYETKLYAESLVLPEVPLL